MDQIHLEEALCDLLGVGVDVISLGALLDRDDEFRRNAVTLGADPTRTAWPTSIMAADEIAAIVGRGQDAFEPASGCVAASTGPRDPR